MVSTGWTLESLSSKAMRLVPRRITSVSSASVNVNQSMSVIGSMRPLTKVPTGMVRALLVEVSMTPLANSTYGPVASS